MNAHGSAARYEEGCRCLSCVLAEARADAARRGDGLRRGQAAGARTRRLQRLERNGHRNVASHELRTGELAVECWCRSRIVYVRPEVVRECRTESCGLRGCSEEIAS